MTSQPGKQTVNRQYRQHTYCPISQGVKADRQWNLVS